MTERLTGKERMDAIKSRRKNVRPDVLPIWFEDMDYLIERVDELERKNYDLREDLAGRHSTVEELNEKIDELYSRNKRYRVSVEKIKRKIESNDERISQLSTEPQFHDPSGRINTLNGQAHGLETALELLEDDSDA